MFLHTLKLVWNKKRSSILMIFELVLALWVLFGLFAVVAHNYNMFSKPLGFEVDSRWAVSFQTDAKWNMDQVNKAKSVVSLLQDLPEVDSVNILIFKPFDSSRWNGYMEYEGKQMLVERNRTNDGSPENLGAKLLEGRWFGPQDAGSGYIPVIINHSLKKAMFGEHGEAVGKEFFDSSKKARESGALPFRITGVIEAFRVQGDFSPDTPYMISRMVVGEDESFFRSFHLVTNGVLGAEFEQKVKNILKQAAPEWSVDVSSYKQLRQQHIDNFTTPIFVAGTVAAFLILMVGFGLFGVLWQSVIKRTQELGLRRALGATAASVQRQIMMEMMVMLMFATFIAGLIYAQFPLLGVIQELDWSLFTLSFGLGTSFLLLLVLACTLYPSLMASRLKPSQALRYE